MTSFCKLAPEKRYALLLRLARESQYRAKELSEKLGISLRQLQRVFERDYNCKPQEWLNEIRMQTAYDLLSETEQVKEVAYSLGFKQTSHFSREFKRVYGCQPSSLKNSAGGNKLRDAPHEQIESFVSAVAAYEPRRAIAQASQKTFSSVLISRESRIARSMEGRDLRPVGYEVEFAQNDQDAVRVTIERTYDLVIFSKPHGGRAIFSTNSREY